MTDTPKAGNMTATPAIGNTTSLLPCPPNPSGEKQTRIHLPDGSLNNCFAPSFS